MLSRRLSALVECGLLERRRYQEHPPRDEYVLTERGRDLRPVVLGLYAYGDRHLMPEGRSMLLVDAETGEEVEPVLVDRATGRPLDEIATTYVPGPAAEERARKRMAYIARLRARAEETAA
jgi:DNA-binding MarR family transcriptional regulator